MNNSFLSLESQKLLTEWLGECWHEIEINLIDPTVHYYCMSCKSTKPLRLDFSDWRVVGRLVEKLLLIASVELLQEYGGAKNFLLLTHINGKTLHATAPTPQLVSCLAICAVLEGE